MPIMNSRLTAFKADRIECVSYAICVTCGVQYGAAVASCPVCEDPRQYVPVSGQAWTSMEALRADHHNRFADEGAFLGHRHGAQVRHRPAGARGRGRPLGLHHAARRRDDRRASGSLRAIAISHPHYYSSMVEWGRAFDCPVLLHEDDREWVMRPDACIEYWSGETYDLGGGMTLIRAGGHFAGGTVLHRGDDLFAGDIVQVIPDRAWVAFMYSFPNYIPLPAASVQAVGAALAPFTFERIYGAWWGAVIEADGSGIVRRSVERYVAALDGYLP